MKVINILLTIAYDGTNYCGWQRQDDMPTIQEEIERAISKTYGRKINIQGASRTDSGVHANGQRATFRLTDNDFKIPIEKIACVINANLPDDIRIIMAEKVSDDFHPITNAVKKTYIYKIWNDEFLSPTERLYATHVYLPLDIDEMRKALRYFIGEHDFSAFCATGGSAKTTIRTIYSFELYKERNLITLEITGNGFLYNMVRIIVGTLIDVGLGRKKASDVENIINSLDRKNAGKTATAKGLRLENIYYDRL